MTETAARPLPFRSVRSATLPVALRRFLLLLVPFAGMLAARPAAAYPWMIRHEYTACASCHADPSGGGLLTLYGRAQGEILLRTHYSKKEMEDPGPAGKFAYGIVPLPDSLLLEAASRSAELQVKTPGGQTMASQFIQMQADFRGQYTLGKFRVNGSLGYADTGVLPAAITSHQKQNLVSREHWLGYDVNDEVLVRAGRMELPFGIRDIQHTMFVRAQTRTDINQYQQHGLAVSYSGAKVRGEAMAIAGDFQVSPDDFRERGYSAFGEYSPLPKTTVGVSSLATHSAVDLQLRRELLRTANGVFARTSPWEPIVLMFEQDFLVNEVAGKGPLRVGNAGVLEGDLEPIQGVHAIAAFEWFHDPTPSVGTSLGYWGGIDWFFAPHADMRVDVVSRNVPAGIGRRVIVRTFLYQFHFYL